MSFGITPAADIFQRVIDTILEGLPGLGIFQDDAIVTGKDDDEHLENLDATLTRLEDSGVRLRKEKCCFLSDSIDYLGYRISREGIQPTVDKIDAIRKAQSPQDVRQLRSFLGMINFYGKFIPNMSSRLHELHHLLNKGVQWNWSESCQTAFKEVKEQLANARILMHYDPALPLELACDASPYGIGAVLLHRLQDGQTKAIAFASKALNVAQCNYSQIDKEALGLVFGVQKCYPVDGPQTSEISV